MTKSIFVLTKNLLMAIFDGNKMMLLIFNILSLHINIDF